MSDFTTMTETVTANRDQVKTPQVNYTGMQDILDENAGKLQTFINDDLIGELNSDGTVTASGAEMLGSKAIPDVSGTKVHAQLVALKALLDLKAAITTIYTQTVLNATTDGDSGADKIGTTAISGVTGETVQSQLESIKNIIDDLVVGSITADSVTEAMMVDAMKKQAGGVFPYDTGSSHVGSSSNPHSVTTAQLNTYTATQIDNLLDDKAETSTYTGTLDKDDWVGTSAPYTQAITVSGIVSTDAPIIDVVMSGTWATDETRKDEWYIYDAITSTNTITFYFYDEPTVDLPFTAKVVK